MSRAAFANPFGVERAELDRQLSAPVGSPAATDPTDHLIARVRTAVARLEAEGLADSRRYGAQEQRVLQSVFLFDLFHLLSGEFDALIRAQLKEAETPCPVPFGRDAIARLVGRGFPAVDAPRYFAMLFQLRRAYFFIDRGLVGQSPCMRQLRRQLWDNVFTNDILLYERHLWNRMEDYSTLLLGETGSGKGTAAAAIGRSGFVPYDPGRGRFVASFASIFIPVNLALYPEALIESELFGHRKGAFTGAIENQEGLLATCSAHGSVFLDEVGDASIPVQVKLLQVLQDRTFSPVGSHERCRFRGRVIAATNRPLGELRRRGLLREDFYYRLCSDCIVVPSLRQRLAEDRGELALVLAKILERLLGSAPGPLLARLLDRIDREIGAAYPWPGNVRELEQCVRRMLLTGHYRPDAHEPPAEEGARLAQAFATGSLTAQELLSAYCASLYRTHHTYEAVALRTGLDRRTVKKYLQAPSKTVERRA
ncbi:MAG TPA: sigma 54-interacting transcriptional regulator [bacterium]